MAGVASQARATSRRPRLAWWKRGVKFIESIAAEGDAGSLDGKPGKSFEQILSGLFTQDAQTNRPVLSIPLPEFVTKERMSTAISGLVNVLGRVISAAGK